MAETVNIQKMAELASAEIFSIFGWERLRFTNLNWECVEKEKHHKKQKGKTTHPSDVVFKYEDPYSGEDIYINADLKSYAKTTLLDSTALVKTLKDLGQSTECADKSLAWKEIFVDQNRNHQVQGMLFVYNHDGEYDKDFEGFLESLQMYRLSLDPGVLVTAVSPQRVIYLNSVAKEIKSLTADRLLPSEENRWFFFPHLKRSPAVHMQSKACPITALLFPLIVLGYEFPDDTEPPRGESRNSWHRRGIYAFYDGPGTSVLEFQYLIDYFFVYQQERGRAYITVNSLFCPDDSAATFELAKKEYAKRYWPLREDLNAADFEKLMENITFRKIQSVVQKFSEIELGMIRA